MSGSWNLCTHKNDYKKTESFCFFKIENIFKISFLSLPQFPFLHLCYWNYLFLGILHPFLAEEWQLFNEYFLILLWMTLISQFTKTNKIKICFQTFSCSTLLWWPKWSRNFVTNFLSIAHCKPNTNAQSIYCIIY